MMCSLYIVYNYYYDNYKRNLNTVSAKVIQSLNINSSEHAKCL